ncbi:hypothetical protein CDL15_Pgr028902 [Punica granatum]|uniref:Transcriptional coactivator Hfi1/Transcriptional adapter 1 n=1 Tax=Punica granatum TaxID=22663 RepID=A0A218WWN3_PUNGR|nr:hypothetical protein CDL15_Pgr028902 [Punica granatum]
MQPQQQSSRIDLGDLKAQIVKRIGAEKSKRYFYYLNRFLSQKLSKSEFDKLCCRALGRDNLPLHNQLIRSILRNACLAKAPPPIHEAGPTKSTLTAAKGSPTSEDGHEQGGSLLQNQNNNSSIWSNGVIPTSPRKGRSAIRDRKLKDRASPLGPNGKVESLYQSIGTEDGGSKIVMENGVLTPRDYSRSLQHLHTVPELPEKEREGLIPQSLDRPTVGSKNEAGLAYVEDGEEVEQYRHLRSSRTPLLAPLGVPFGSRKFSSVGTSGDVVSCQDFGGLFDVETLRRRMQHIVAAQGLGGVSMECANVLNIILDVYLKRLISSCVQVAGAKSVHEPQRSVAPRQQIPGRVLNGMWPTNSSHLNLQSSGGTLDGMEERRPHSISLLDFKVAMELNPQQLGEAWPLLLEFISLS